VAAGRDELERAVGGAESADRDAEYGGGLGLRPKAASRLERLSLLDEFELTGKPRGGGGGLEVEPQGL
jgi:hypothetical protein